jgi:sugar O-acyltransferase (sialic acid O-acetyltransferase NeuD family)
MRTEIVALLGAGGHAKVVYDAILAARLAQRVLVRDDDPHLRDAKFLDTRIAVPIGPLEALPELVHVGIGGNRARADLAIRIAAAGRRLLTVIHPGAAVSTRCELGAGTFAAAGAIVAATARVGECAIINHHAVVDHDCAIGRWAHIAPAVALGGGVQVGEGALVGSGAVVLPGVSIGKWVVVGAGAVVTRPVADGETVYGVPARRRSDA